MRLKQFSIFRLLTGLCALLMPVILLILFFLLAKQSLPALKTFGWHFLFSSEWDPAHEVFGAGSAILGTLLSALIAMLLAGPASVLAAMFIVEVAPSGIGRILRGLVDVMAGIPSIVYGMWGLFVVVPFMADWVEPVLTHTLGYIPFLGALFQGDPVGIGLLTAGFILSLMVFPIMTAMAVDLFETLPTPTREAAYALGALRFEVLTKVFLPYARNGLLGTFMLGLGRALGETMAVTFVIGNAHYFSWSLLSPATTISATLANEFSEAFGSLYPASLMSLGLILFGLTFIVMLLARMLLSRYHH